MAMVKRVFLFLLTNILVMVTISIAFTLITKFLGIETKDSYMTYLVVFSAVWGMGGAFISLLMSKWMAKMAMRVKIIDPNTNDPELRDIVQTVHNLARQARLPKMPEVGYYESPDINAFATGPSKSNSLVAVSTGLLKRMNRSEVEGVLGHEVAHIANGDMVTMTLIQGIVNAFVLFFSRILSNIIASQVDERHRFAVQFGLTLAFDIIFTILGSIVVNYFSQLREYRADAGGARIATREKMIMALQKLQSFTDATQYQPSEQEQAMATLQISSRKRSGIMALFSTHPPLSERIRRLERMAI